MITAEIFEIINFYRDLIEKIERENSNPFEISIEKLKELAGDSIFHNGIIISLLAKLIRLKAEYLEKQIIPQTEEEKKEAVKSIFKQVLQEETGLEDDDIEALLMVDSIKEKLKKPKAVKPKKISYQEFQEITKNEIKDILHEDTDYNAYALEIAKQIEKRTFKIRSHKDFIGLMFAITLFNLEIDDIRKFIIKREKK